MNVDELEIRAATMSDPDLVLSTNFSTQDVVNFWDVLSSIRFRLSFRVTLNDVAAAFVSSSLITVVAAAASSCYIASDCNKTSSIDKLGIKSSPSFNGIKPRSFPTSNTVPYGRPIKSCVQ